MSDHQLSAREREFCKLYRRDGDAVVAYTGAFRAKTVAYARKAAAKLLRRNDIHAFIEGLPRRLTSDRERLELVRDAHLAIVQDTSASPQERAAAARAATGAMRDLKALGEHSGESTREELLAFIRQLKASPPCAVCPHCGEPL